MACSNPAARTVDAHAKMRNVTKRQRDQRQRKPKPPCPLPEVIVDQRSERADYKPDADPNRLALDKEINVPMAVTRKCARAEKHDDADDEQSQHSEKKNVCTLTIHS